MRHRRQHLAKQCDALADTQLLRLAVAQDVSALDVFHDKKRQSGAVHAGINQRCNMGVLQGRKHLAFLFKALQQRRRECIAS